MGFSRGKESKEGSAVKRYIGIAPVKVLGVNPTKEELEKMYDADIQNEPSYIGESDIQVGGVEKTVPSIRLDFIVQTDPEVTDGINMTTKIAFFLNKENRFNKNADKVQVIDKYGRTAWGTVEDIENKTIPEYANGPANIDADFRPALIGEEALTKFIKDYLNIPNPQNYVDGKWVDKSAKEMAECEARFADLNPLFKGDVSQLREILSYQPDNKIKLAFGVKITDDNDMYQDVYNREFMKAGATNNKRLKKEIENAQAAGSFPNTEFDFGPLREYSLIATDFGTSETVENPFSGAKKENPFG